MAPVRRVQAIAATVALLFAAACVKPPIREELSIELSRETDAVVVTAETTFDLESRAPVVRERVDAARAAVEAGTDPWATRFARVSPEADRLALDRSRGVLERVTRSARIAPEELQQIFADTNITVTVVRGDGWRELAFYSGTSNRGSREQHRRFEEELERWSRSVAIYFQALQRLYAYLDEQPQRARWVFAALLNEKNFDGPGPVVLEDEQPLIEDTVEAMAAIATGMERQMTQAPTLGEQADLLFNPFPARITVRLPGEAVALHGFAAQGDSVAVIEPIDLLAIVSELEGRWVDPDPLAVLLREESPTPDALAAKRRRASPVTSSTEIAAAVRERLVRPRTFVVRWRE